MKLRVFPSLLRPVLPLAGLVWLSAATARACIQGHRFDPPKPVKIHAPKPPPLKLDVWLHAAILHAKLKLRDDPAWLKAHSVIDSAHVGQREAEEIVRAIDYQLAERLQFVSAPDAVVCDLFYQAALRVTGDEADERRAHYFRESLRFGNWRKAQIRARAKS